MGVVQPPLLEFLDIMTPFSILLTRQQERESNREAKQHVLDGFNSF